MKRLLLIGASGLPGNKLMEQGRGWYDVRGSYYPTVDGKGDRRLEPLAVGFSGERVQNVWGEQARRGGICAVYAPRAGPGHR